MSDPLRFFVPELELNADPVEITGETFHHLHHVLRTQTGQLVTLLDGKGTCCEVSLIAISSDHAIGKVLSRWHEEDNTLAITLIQALPKGDKFELILQKGTELGISSFQPIITEYTVPQLSPSRLAKREQRWKRIANEAARQSRRSILPIVKPLVKLDEAIEPLSNNLKLVLWEEGSRPLQEALQGKNPSAVQLLIGPEGGFSQQEISKATEAGFIAVHLGPRILRTETAGLAATPVLQYLYGDWRQAPGDIDKTQYEEKP